jgi:hypothetical protein
MNKKIITTVSSLVTGFLCFAQNTVEAQTLNYDPDHHKIIPDKVFEIGMPLLFLYLLLNTIVSVLKNRAEAKLKLKLLEKEVSEETLIKIFNESNAIVKLQPLKWFLFTLAISISLAIIHVSRNYLIGSGYLAIAILLFFLSISFYVYYHILSKRLNHTT